MTMGAQQITSPVSTFPSNWTQADIERYLAQFAANQSAGIPNYAPWWISAPEWKDTGVTFPVYTPPPAMTIAPIAPVSGGGGMTTSLSPQSAGPLYSMAPADAGYYAVSTAGTGEYTDLLGIGLLGVVGLMLKRRRRKKTRSVPRRLI